MRFFFAYLSMPCVTEHLYKHCLKAGQMHDIWCYSVITIQQNLKPRQHNGAFWKIVASYEILREFHRGKKIAEDERIAKVDLNL